MTRVSIGMPVFNGAAQISRAVGSLLDQTYPGFELIVSDNASTDATAELCSRFAEKDVRVRYFRQASNIGAAANFRYVYEKAVGEYFFWAPHDDFWDRGFVEAGVVALDKHPSASSSFGTVRFLGPEGQELFIQHPPDFLGEDSPYRRLLAYFSGSVSDVLVYSMFRREALSDFSWTPSMGFEKKVILHLVARGPVVPTDNMLQMNYLSAKSQGEVLSLFPMDGARWDDAMRRVFLDSLQEIRSCLGWSEFLRLLPRFIRKDKWHRFFAREAFQRLAGRPPR